MSLKKFLFYLDISVITIIYSSQARYWSRWATHLFKYVQIIRKHTCLHIYNDLENFCNRADFISYSEIKEIILKIKNENSSEMTKFILRYFCSFLLMNLGHGGCFIKFYYNDPFIWFYYLINLIPLFDTQFIQSQRYLT